MIHVFPVCCIIADITCIHDGGRVFVDTVIRVLLSHVLYQPGDTNNVQPSLLVSVEFSRTWSSLWSTNLFSKDIAVRDDELSMMVNLDLSLVAHLGENTSEVFSENCGADTKLRDGLIQAGWVFVCLTRWR